MPAKLTQDPVGACAPGHLAAERLPWAGEKTGGIMALRERDREVLTRMWG
jgi:hypothetical protein